MLRDKEQAFNFRFFTLGLFRFGLTFRRQIQNGTLLLPL